MSFNLPGAASIRVNATSVSIPVMLRSTTDNTGLAGKVFGDITAQYWRQGGTATAITEATLSGVDAAYSSGGFLQVDATNMPGLYRFDVPNAAFVHGADWVVVSLKCTGAYTVILAFSLVYDGQVRSFTPQALDTGTLTLDAGADDGDGAYLGKSFVVVNSSDPTDLGAVFECHTSYTGATKVALGSWTRKPTGTVPGTPPNDMVIVASADAGNLWGLEATSQSILADTGTDGVVVAGLDAAALQQIVDDLENAGRLDALIDAIKAKTDSLTFTQAGHVDSNVQRVNDVLIVGNGAGTPFNV